MRLLSVILIGIFAGTLFISCPATGADGKVLRLPSGKEVLVKGVGKIYLTQSKEWVLNLDYQNNLSIDDPVALQREVEEIWPIFKGDADKADVRIAAINANEPSKGFIVQKNRSFRFVWA